MARAHHTSSTSKHSRPIVVMAASSPALLHAAWITAVVAVCLALCTIHSRKPSSSSSSSSASSRRRRGSRPASSSSNHHHHCGSSWEGNGAAGAGSVGGTAAATAAKVSPTPSDTAKASGGPVTVIDVGTHGPIPPAFLPPDPVPPRRSLSSAKHTRFAERVRSMRRGGSGEAASAAAAAAAEDDVFVGCHHRGGEVGEEGTLWTKTIILGDRCRVPSSSDEEDGGVDGVTTVKKWRSYRPPRQPRSVPLTRSNSFAGVGSAAARRPTNPRF